MVKRIAVAALAMFTACTFPEQPLPPGEKLVVVHAVLDPSKSVQLIHLGVTEGANAAPTYLDRADVKLTLPDGRTLTARQDSLRDSTGKLVQTLPDYRIDLAAAGVGLVSGGKYGLRVATVAGDTVTGETTLPSASASPMPAAASFNRLADTLRLTWSAVAGARTFEVQVWSRDVFNYAGTFTYAHLNYAGFRDTSVTLAGSARYFDDDVFRLGPTPESRTHVYVLAVDDNYYEYYRLLGDPFRGAAPSRVKGGLGVFGSVVPIIQRELIVK